MGKIVLMIVDEQPFLRTELRNVIIHGSSNESIEILECGPGLDGNEAVAQIDTFSPDVVLLDINYPHLSGLVLCRKLVRTTPQTKVVLITGNPAEDDDELFQAIRSGASAYLTLESCTPQEFVATIERAARGEYPINDSVNNKPQIALRVLRQFEEIICNVSKEDDISTPLNPKEAEILAHVVKGKANREIGFILGISESAVKKQISSILRKLNANDRAHAAVLAVRSGIVSIQPDGSISISNSDVSLETSDTIKEHTQILEEARYIRSKMLSDAEEIASQIIKEARQTGKDDADKIIAEARQQANQIIEQAKQKCADNASKSSTKVECERNQSIEQEAIKDQEMTTNEKGQSSNLYDGVIELALAPPVHLSTLCELHKQLKRSPTVDVLSIKGSVTEGLQIRMLIKAPIAILEFVKGISAVKDASVDDSPVQAQISKDVKRILVTTY